MFSFVDPTTAIISAEASEISCSSAKFFLFHVANTSIKFDPLSGSSYPVHAHEISTLDLPTDAIDLLSAPPLTIFHNLVLTNISQLVPEGHLQEIWQACSYDRFLANIESRTHPEPSPVTTHMTENSSFSFLFFGWSPFYIWVTICCIGTSLLFLKFAVVTYITIAYPGLSQFLHRVGRPHIPTEHPSLALPYPVHQIFLQGRGTFQIRALFSPVRPVALTWSCPALKLTHPGAGPLEHR
ncbi:hypothetical protein Y032_0631g858 [Ancylostoma ceylanicum]|nr:hypothetical protein Y032_0631g858 [Ancylostoma ceylanicum]